MQNANRRGVFPLIAELRRVMKHQDRSVVRRHPFPNSLKMSGQNLFFTNPAVRKKRYAALVLAQS